MKETFMLEDLLDVLIQLEALGSKHYRKLSTIAADEKSKELFLHLADEERNHQAAYEKYKQQKIAFESNSINDEYRAYVSALLENALSFLKKDEKAEDLNEAYHLAIKFEKETLLFLNEVKSIIDKRYEKAIETLIDEERRHLKLLLEMR